MTGIDLAKAIRAYMGAISVNVASPRGGDYWVPATKKSLIQCFSDKGDEETFLKLAVIGERAYIVPMDMHLPGHN